MSDVENARNNPVIRKYLKDVLSWHGYIRFLGMPTLQTSSDVPLEELYVNQSLSLENLSTEKEPKENQLYSPLHLLIEKRHLVILGDPGSGKSTLINWLAWILASGFIGRLPNGLGTLIPIPIVLRELKLESVVTFESLIDAFLERPIAKALSSHKQLLIELLATKQILLLVDGLDEVSLDVRDRIQDIFKDFFQIYGGNFSIFTSRKVGYEQAPLVPRKKDSYLKVVRVMGRIVQASPTECYIAPFTSKQIERFSLNWYRENTTGNNDSAFLLKDEFVNCIRSNESTLQLARTPHLLTMMALIFKRRSQLPNGRALLYELIAQAYLESIDTARKLKDPFLWQEKKRWLARVAFEMQLQRFRQIKEKKRGRELLASREQVLEWIVDAMRESNISDSIDISSYASVYLDWIARRSGLLLPRGEGQYAFSHLSFQEYFSAVYIQQQVENPEYFESDSDYETLDKRFIKKPIRSWAQEYVWNQVFIFLFELIADKPGWLKKIWKECFDFERSCKALRETNPMSLAILGSEREEIFLQISLLLNPHVGPYNKNYQLDLEKIILYSFMEQDFVSKKLAYYYMDSLGEHFLSVLLNHREFTDTVISKVSTCFKSKGIFLKRVAPSVILRVLNEISHLEKIEHVVFHRCGIESMDGFSLFKNVRYLSLVLNHIQDLGGLTDLAQLAYLDLSNNPVVSLNGISELYQLETLVLDGEQVESYSPLFSLPKLKSLTCSNLDNIDFVFQLVQLEELKICNSPKLKDISALSNHRNLKRLFISGQEAGDIILWGGECDITVYYM